MHKRIERVSSTFDIILAPVLIVAADIVIYVFVGRLGSRSSGKSVKFEPFTGGETDVPKRGVYRSELFVFGMLFLIVEAFALLLAGSYAATSSFYPLLFVLGGSAVIMLTVWWFLIAGGGKF
jgi:NADH:ubiquinone oxidoreductase subunit 3 (subunit A)